MIQPSYPFHVTVPCGFSKVNGRYKFVILSMKFCYPKDSKFWNFCFVGFKLMILGEERWR